MNETECQQFLAALHVGVLAVERRDRSPLTVPMWYGYEPGGEVVMWTHTDRVKYKLIRDAGRFAINVQDEQPPYKYVTAEGDVTSIEEAGDAEAFKIASRYLGEDEGRAFTDEHLNSTAVIIRMRPHRWISADYSAE